MSTSVLVAYATRYGSTQEVAEAVAATLRESGLEVDLQPMRTVGTLTGYSAIVLGAPLYMFRWHKDALRFLARHRQALTERPVAVFALGPVHDPYDESEWQSSRAQLDKELAKFPWLVPVAVEIVGGKFDPAKLRFPINLFAGKEPASDIRDWTAIRAWASDLPGKLQPAVA
jgi:menaquinone-dependent protoporphyrinogen oxidase